MLNVTVAKRLGSLLTTVFLLALVAMNCKLSSLPGGKMNMFQWTNAKDGATRIKQKLGVDDVKVKYIEIHEQRMQITLQDPAKPKNFDEYTYANGAVTGPKPVEALVLVIRSSRPTRPGCSVLAT